MPVLDYNHLLNVAILDASLQDSAPYIFNPRQLHQLHPSYLTPDSCDEDSGTPEETQEMLDILAFISLNQPQHEVVATTLSISTARITLCLAQSEGSVSDKTLKFLQTLWGLLTRLSNVVSRGPGSPSGSPKYEAIRVTVHDIQRTVWTHCIPRFQHTLEKRFSEFLTSWHTFRQRHDPYAFGELHKILSHIGTCIISIHTKLHEEPIKVDDVSTLVVHLCPFVESFQKHGRTHEMRSFARHFDVDCDSLISYFSQCIELYLHVRSLIAFATSSLSTPYFDRHLVLKRITSEPVEMTFTDWSVEDWRESLFQLVESGGKCSKQMNWSSSHEVSLDQLAYDAHRRARTLPRTAHIHPECLLLQYHHNLFMDESEEYEPPFKYIGCSHAPCVGCHYYFWAYRQAYCDNVAPLFFFTPDTDFEVHPCWVMPELEGVNVNDRVRAEFETVLRERYWHYLKRKMMEGREHLEKVQSQESLKSIEHLFL